MFLINKSSVASKDLSKTPTVLEFIIRGNISADMEMDVSKARHIRKRRQQVISMLKAYYIIVEI